MFLRASQKIDHSIHVAQDHSHRDDSVMAMIVRYWIARSVLLLSMLVYLLQLWASLLAAAALLLQP